MLIVRIASEQRGTATPASAKDQFVVHFSYEVGLVSNDLGIHTPRTEEGRLDLFGRVVARAEYSGGCRNERLDGWNVGKRRLPDLDQVVTRLQRVRRRHVGQRLVAEEVARAAAHTSQGQFARRSRKL